MSFSILLLIYKQRSSKWSLTNSTGSRSSLTLTLLLKDNRSWSTTSAPHHDVGEERGTWAETPTCPTGWRTVTSSRWTRTCSTPCSWATSRSTTTTRPQIELHTVVTTTTAGKNYKVKKSKQSCHHENSLFQKLPKLPQLWYKNLRKIRNPIRKQMKLNYNQARAPQWWKSILKRIIKWRLIQPTYRDWLERHRQPL